VKIEAVYVPFFIHNTPEQLERLAKGINGQEIKIGMHPIGKVINAYVKDGKIWWEGEIQNSCQKVRNENA